jgi:hypothetical protein
MDKDMVAYRHALIGQQKQADLAPDTLGLTAGCVALNADDPHRNSETHGVIPAGDPGNLS